MAECQWIGPEQRVWPFKMCGCQTLAGKSYCGEHYWRVYQKGTAIAGRRKEREIEREIAELKAAQDINLENEDA